MHGQTNIKINFFI